MQKLLTFLIAIFMVFSGVNAAYSADNAETPTPEFTVTTTPDTSEFGFFISAAGTFTIDWGDGTVETFTKGVTGNASWDNYGTWYSHTYDTTQSYTIGISGDATAYHTDEHTAAIRFYRSFGGFHAKIASISGSLGKIFGNLSDGTRPRFYYTFSGCTSLTSIPGGLFAGITSGAYEMFAYTFEDCTSLTSIPGDLFAGITSGADYMFSSTFRDCTSLKSIPGDLFASIQGPVAEHMFSSTFNGCTSLKSIPGDLFAGITSGAEGMFGGTFYGCTSLTSIPGDLFAGITTGVDFMFSMTFSYCTSLTSIPGELFAGITSGADYMFDYTFNGCTSLKSIPGDLFASIQGPGAVGMFRSTFEGCSSLTGYVGGNMFTVPADGYGNMYYGTFYGASKMDTVCPAGTYAVPKPDPNWTVAVCLPCPAGTVSPADSQSIDACVIERCDISIMSSTGVVIPTYPNPRTTPSIAIPYGDSACYVDVETDTESSKYYILAE